MRALLVVVAATFLAGCASTPAMTNMTKVWDQKYNQPRYAVKPSDSDFVGTSAMAGTSARKLPSWYARGHP